MNKKELSAAVADANEISVAAAERIINSVFASIGEAVKQEGKVAIFGFGTFSLKERPAREGRNPRTGETVKLKASKSVTFKAAKALKDSL